MKNNVILKIKKIIVLYLLCLIINSCSTTKTIIKYNDNGLNLTPIHEFSVVEKKEIKHSYSNSFPITKLVVFNNPGGYEQYKKDKYTYTKEEKKKYFAFDSPTASWIVLWVVPYINLVIPALDFVVTPFILFYDAIIPKTKTYSYKISLSIDGRLVNINNKPIKCQSLFVNFSNKVYQITTDDKGFIKETIEFNTSQYNNKQEFSKQIEFKFDSNNPKQISYSYPFKEGTRYIIDKNSKKIESKIKAEGKVIVIDQIK